MAKKRSKSNVSAAQRGKPTSGKSAGRPAFDPPFEGLATGPTVQFVIVPDHVPFVNNGRLWSGGRLVQRAPRLAICHDRITGDFVLLFCDNRWRIRFVTARESVEAAKRAAERSYSGLMPHWVDLGVTDAQADEYMKRLRRTQGCSFCGRAPAEHDGVQFQKGRARICADCVRELYRELSSVESAEGRA